MGRRKKTREQTEYDRLAVLYADIPANKRELVDGLLRQAARLKTMLDDLYADIQEHGEVEIVTVKDEARTVKRPQAELFTARDKNYQAVMKQLNDLLPEKKQKTGLAKMDEDE